MRRLWLPVAMTRQVGAGGDVLDGSICAMNDRVGKAPGSVKKNASDARVDRVEMNRVRDVRVAPAEHLASRVMRWSVVGVCAFAVGTVLTNERAFVVFSEGACASPVFLATISEGTLAFSL